MSDLMEATARGRGRRGIGRGGVKEGRGRELTTYISGIKNNQ